MTLFGPRKGIGTSMRSRDMRTAKMEGNEECLEIARVSDYLPVLLCFAHRAFCASLIGLRPSADGDGSAASEGPTPCSVRLPRRSGNDV
jgi:hypothetical protein